MLHNQNLQIDYVILCDVIPQFHWRSELNWSSSSQLYFIFLLSFPHQFPSNSSSHIKIWIVSYYSITTSIIVCKKTTVPLTCSRLPPNFTQVPRPAGGRRLPSGRDLHVKSGLWPENIHQKTQKITKSTKTTTQPSTCGLPLEPQTNMIFLKFIM
jgi:hypothetical protein